MSKRLDCTELVFEDILEEIRVLVFQDYYEDSDGNWYEPLDNEDNYSNNPLVEHVDAVFESGGYDEYLFMKYIFKYKGKFFSIVKNENSYGDSGFETDTLKEVKPSTKEVVVYE